MCTCIHCDGKILYNKTMKIVLACFIYNCYMGLLLYVQNVI